MKTPSSLVAVLACAACASNPEPQPEPTATATATATAPEPVATGTEPTATATATAAPTGSAAAAPGDGRKKAIMTATATVSMIARFAMGAYEREQADGKHALCKTAKAVPTKVPVGGEGVKTADADWGGDDKTGWKCLRFLPSEPVPAQYSYTAGATPKLLSRKKAAGDSDTFEVCAEMDLVAGDKTTLVCATGKIDKKTNSVKLDSGVIVDEE